MKKREQRRPMLGGALSWRIAVAVLLMWLVGMIYLTVTVAQSEYLRYAADVRAKVSSSSQLDYDPQKNELENRAVILNSARSMKFHQPRLDIPFYTEYATATGFLHHIRPKNSTPDWTVAVYDASGHRIVGENNYVYLTYRDTYEEYYPEDSVVGYTYIDLNRTACGRAMIEKWQDHNGYCQSYYLIGPRLTGYFDGDEFVLVDVSHVTNKDWYVPQWESEFDGDKSSSVPLVHIYPADMIMDHADCQVRLADGVMMLEDVTQLNKTDEPGYMKENWASVEELLRDHSEQGNKYRKTYLRWNSNNLFESVITKRGYYQDASGKECLYIVSVRVEPIRIAMSLLPEVYFLTFFFVLLLLLVIYLRIRRELLLPMENMVEYARVNYPSTWRGVESRWLEPHFLQKELMAAQERVRELNKEKTQLSTALDYAHNAEDNRRRMVSNITHELKTPLAVIHSYAEGLKEGIAADKQEQYLDVILEESERMDAMVLQMLDLSRLEAGKVRLASDRFSLLELTKHVFDKLRLLVEEKELEVEYIWPQDFEITADEQRMEQAITNLVSNAIKYSPRGGSIWINVTSGKNGKSFAIENQCEPLSDEQLSCIWDSFYRADESRTEKGTGLGLPITKAIIELHGGTCTAEAISSGVRFGFKLP